MSKTSNAVKNPLLLRAIKICGGQKLLADVAGVRQQTISRMLRGATPISAEVAVGVEIATRGKITRRKLRPDLFLPLSQLNPNCGGPPC